MPFKDLVLFDEKDSNNSDKQFSFLTEVIKKIWNNKKFHKELSQDADMHDFSLDRFVDTDQTRCLGRAVFLNALFTTKWIKSQLINWNGHVSLVVSLANNKQYICDSQFSEHWLLECSLVPTQDGLYILKSDIISSWWKPILVSSWATDMIVLADILNNISNYYMKNKEYQNAFDASTMSTFLLNDPNQYFNKANALWWLWKHNDAIKEYDHALTMIDWLDNIMLREAKSFIRNNKGRSYNDLWNNAITRENWYEHRVKASASFALAIKKNPSSHAKGNFNNLSPIMKERFWAKWDFDRMLQVNFTNEHEAFDLQRKKNKEGMFNKFF